MSKVLKNMSQWDSFIDVVNQLTEVINLENLVRNKTEELKKNNSIRSLIANGRTGIMVRAAKIQPNAAAESRTKPAFRLGAHMARHAESNPSRIGKRGTPRPRARRSAAVCGSWARRVIASAERPWPP